MFYSYEQLVGRNAKFALVWKMATASQKRKSIPKAAILDVSVPDICKQLMELVPSTTSIGELRSKFSLYLLAQLLYGVTLVFERQTGYLETDARAAQLSVEQLFLNAPLQTPKRKGKGRDDERGAKRPRLEKDVVGLADLPPVDLTTLDAVGVALYNQITLQDEIPRGAPEPVFDELAPLTREELNEWSRDYEAVHSRQSNNGSNEAAKITEVEEINIMQKELSQLEELPPLEPLQENTPISNNGTTIQREREPTPVNEDVKMFDNIQLDRTVAVEAGLKRRGPRALRMRDDVTMNPIEMIKENVSNFSSTVRSRNEILVGLQLDKNRDLEDMLKPYPTWRRRSFNKELRHLFQTKEIRKITYDEAGAIDPNVPQPRGRESELWRYEGSSDNMGSRQESDRFPPLDDDLRLIGGIAFLHPTPEKNKHPKSLLEEEFQMPPLASLMELEELEPFGQTTGQSAMEEVRRSIGMHKSGASDRRETLLDEDFPSRGGMGRALLIEEFAVESSVEAITSRNVIEKSIFKGLRNTHSEGISFQKMFPPANNSRKRAARAFTVVLEMLKFEKILAAQDRPYGTILLQLAQAQPPA